MYSRLDSIYVIIITHMSTLGIKYVIIVTIYVKGRARVNVTNENFEVNL